jgi:hypothetical protein
LSAAIPNSDIKITCLTWSSNLPSLNYDPVGTNPVVMPIMPSNRIDQVKITWWRSTQDAGTGSDTCGNTSQLTLGLNCLPTLRIAAAQEGSISNAGVIFLNPSNAEANNTIRYGSTDSGSIANAACNPTNRSCVIILNIGSWTNGYFSITSLNGQSWVSIEPVGASYLTKAQAKVDATAISQDVIKRLVAYVSLTKTTWRPDFVTSANALCKNYRLDGSTNSVAGPAGATCP